GSHILKRNNPFISQAVSIRIIRIGIVDKRSAHASYIDRWLEQNCRIVFTLKLLVEEGKSGRYVKFHPDGIGVIHVEDSTDPVGICHSDGVGTPSRIGMFPDIKIPLDIVFQWSSFAIDSGHCFSSTVPPIYDQTVAIYMAGCLGIGYDGYPDGQISDLFIGDLSRPIVRGQYCMYREKGQIQGQEPSDCRLHRLTKDTK